MDGDDDTVWDNEGIYGHREVWVRHLGVTKVIYIEVGSTYGDAIAQVSSSSANSEHVVWHGGRRVAKEDSLTAQRLNLLGLRSVSTLQGSGSVEAWSFTMLVPLLAGCGQGERRGCSSC